MSHEPPRQPDDDHACASLRLDEASGASADMVLDHGTQGSDGAWSSPGASRLASLLHLLEMVEPPPTPADTKLLIDVTMARVARGEGRGLVARIGSLEEPGPRLSRADALALDASAENGWSTVGTGPLAALMSRLDDTGEVGVTSEPRERSRLVEASLALVQRHADERSLRMRLPAEELSVRPRARAGLWDVLAAGVAVGVGTMIVAPMIINAREATRETMCADNMGRAALGFTLFAGDHQGALPSVSALRRGGEVAFASGSASVGPWWNVGDERASHSANLFALVRGGYASPADLTCPGNPAAQTEFPAGASDWNDAQSMSYGYQLFATHTPRWFSGAVTLVLADKSPVAAKARLGQSCDASLASTNHIGRGQNTLSNDGAVRFLHSPVLENGDNIWLPRSLEMVSRPRLTGKELPANERDAFIGP